MNAAPVDRAACLAPPAPGPLATGAPEPETAPPPSPWSNVYELARTLLALGTLSTLALHSADELFRPAGIAMSDLPGAPPLARFSLFVLLGAHQEIARFLAVSALALVAIGWRPRFTGVLHWWISFSFAVSAGLIEGGDQVTANLTLLLVPVTLTDGRRWHWAAPPACGRLRTQVGAAVAASALLVARLQVAIIYLHAAVGKTAVAEWVNGTATYYWFLHPTFGAPDWLRAWLAPLLAHGPVVMALTWGTILLEFVLFAGLFMEKRYRGPLLVAGLAFHLGIVLVHGLASFFLAMAGALVLFLRGPREPFGNPIRGVADAARTAGSPLVALAARHTPWRRRPVNRPLAGA